MQVKDLAAWLGATHEGDPRTDLQHVASLEEAGPEDLSFVSSKKSQRHAADSQAGCLLVPLDFPNDQNRTIIRTIDPRAAVAKAIAKLHPPIQPHQGIHPTAVVDPEAQIGKNVSVGPQAVIGKSKIGAGTTIGAGTVIADHVELGEDCLIHANVTIYRDVKIGSHVILHSGCVLGADGFGFVFSELQYQKFPQIGRVEIADRVEIGANSCVDRAALGVTSIGEGSKLDNLVHVGHNCRIGRHVVIAAQTGFSGGVVVEDYAIIGGQVGVGDKARIESRAVLGSGSGVLTSKIVRAGQVMWGTPARPLKQYLEQLAALSRLAKKKKSDS
jgi:UDP-3-O-[3-hydroxymyristoyl] glucosamine N-acyltransferase